MLNDKIQNYNGANESAAINDYNRANKSAAIKVQPLTQPKKNDTVERYKLFTRVQEAGETLDKFIADVKILAATCNFKQLKESLIRDQIICGMTDSKL